MKYIIVALLFSVLSVNGQNTFVPDDNFEQALIDLGYDSGPLDNIIPTANIENIDMLFLGGKGINDLTGIEDFTALTTLNVDDNNLNFVDLRGNVNLKKLAINRSQLVSIDLSNNLFLEALTLDDNQLTELDVSKNNKLTLLNVNFNQLQSLNIDSNPNILSLSCLNNNITSFSLPENSSMDFLQVTFNPISNLDLSNGKVLTYLSAVEMKLEQLDLSKNNLLEILLISFNNIKTIDLSNNNLLFGLWIDNNPISQIDLSQNSDLAELRFGNTKLETLNLSLNSKLIRVDGGNNPLLCSLDLRNMNNTLITDFFNLSNCPQLECVFVDDVNYSLGNWPNIDNKSNFIISEEDCLSKCCPSSFDFELTLENIFIENNDIKINLNDNQGFLYALDNNDNYQKESLFSNVSQGFHTIYVTDENRCLEKSLDIFVEKDVDLFIPKFFTPNGDQNNDFWKIIDPKQVIKTIYIHDRYGKLLKTLSPTSNGWNGKFNGQFLPNSSYWYKINFKTGESINGYFSLIR